MPSFSFRAPSSRCSALVALLAIAPIVAQAQDTTTARPAAPVTPAASPTAPTPAAAAPAKSTAPSTAPTVIPAGSPAAADLPASDLANSYVQRAVSLYEMGKDEAAIAEYRRGIAHDPLDSDTWYGLAEVLHDLGRDKQAIETYELALSTIEHAPELRVPFADLLMANKRKADAVKVLQRGIEIDPDASAEMKAKLGQVLLDVLDDTATVAAPAAKPASPKAKPRQVKKRKKLCNMFCPGAFDPVAKP